MDDLGFFDHSKSCSILKYFCNTIWTFIWRWVWIKAAYSLTDTPCVCSLLTSLASQTSRADGGQRWLSEHHENHTSRTNEGGHGLVAYCLSQMLF